MSQPQRIRRTCLFHGHVQGVGFRVTAIGLARGLDVAGYVRNLSDGRVELVGEGPAAQLQLLEDRIQATFAGYIRDVERSEQQPTGEFQGFDMRR